ncbi:TerD family protein, partial [Streptomyces sp. YIM 98790]|uniref:TerD family protein n=1 Tax=Streptomyces sp. YIM 98790 TaxID=2689077 RepID=UPI001407A7DE
GVPGGAARGGGRDYAPTTVDPRLAVLTPPVGSTVPLPESQLLPGARQAERPGSPREGVLRPGQKSGPLPQDAERLTVRLTWSADPGLAVQPEVDASVFVVGSGGEVLSDLHFVFYNNVGAPDQSVWLDEPEPGATERRVGVSIPLLAVEAERVVLALSIHAAQERGHDTGLLRRLTVRVCDAESGAELCGYRVPAGAPDASAMTVGELYRGPGGWGFHAVTCGYLGGLLEIAQTHGINAG